jgi:hypothetical protein
MKSMQRDETNMGSRVMHYCISTILKHELQIHDDQFLLGSLAPDVHKSNSEPKKTSHFMRKDEGGIGYIDYHCFYDKYLSSSPTPFHLGYYFHLISDDVWLRDIYYKKIKWLPREKKTEAKEKYYRDFWRLNGKLIDYYSLELVPLNERPVEMDEIDYTLLPEIINDLKSDFNMADSAKDEMLEILEFTEVIQTIERTIIACLANSKRVWTSEYTLDGMNTENDYT